MTLLDWTFFLILALVAGAVAVSLARAIACIIRGRND
jgi:hypothetical protein